MCAQNVLPTSALALYEVLYVTTGETHDPVERGSENASLQIFIPTRRTAKVPSRFTVFYGRQQERVKVTQVRASPEPEVAWITGEWSFQMTSIES